MSSGMAKDKRTNIAGATYHVMNRGNRKGLIFEDDADRQMFRRMQIDEQEVHGVNTLADCLIGNHFHLAVQTPHGNLSDFMERLEGRFARYSNLRHHRVGHLFQGPFRDVLIEDDLHLLTAVCYILLNPVAAGLTPTPEEYRWSSYAATAGLRPLPPYLTIDWLLALFPQSSLAEAQLRFRALMNQPSPVVAYVLESELNVHPDVIKNVIRSYTGEQLQAATLPHAYRTALRPPLDELFRDHTNDRATFIRDARMLYGYKSAEIARVLSVHPATVSKIFCCHRRLKSVPRTDIGCAG
jgi:putative transposase